MMPRGQRPLLTELWHQLQSGEHRFTEAPVFETIVPTGERVLLEATVDLPVEDRDRVVVVLREVTQQVRRTASLERAWERFRLAF